MRSKKQRRGMREEPGEKEEKIGRNCEKKSGWMRREMKKEEREG